MKNILFDLDGTLLPMDEDAFTRLYFGYLCKWMAPFGFESDKLIATIWKGTQAMYGNDGSQSNEDAFWEVYQKRYDEPKEKHHQNFQDFYTEEFNKAIAGTSPTPLARQIIDVCHEKGFNVYLATNPLFPRVATLNRIRWAGLKEEDFLDITSYENCFYTKPVLGYFIDFCRNNNIDPKESIMIGNDITEDLAARELGMKTYLVTDCLMNRGNRDNVPDYSGTLSELLQFLKEL